MGFDYDGIDKLIGQLEGLSEAGEDIQKHALKEGAEELKDIYKDNIYDRIDRQTGNARDSITVSRYNKSGKIYVGPTQQAFYLEYLINGFYNVRAGEFISATPIFEPIFMQNRRKVIEAMIDAAQEEMSKL